MNNNSFFGGHSATTSSGKLSKSSLSRDGNPTTDDEDSDNSGSTSERFSQRITFMTRSLVKNNIISQNFYIALITLEYLSMIYYIFRLVDNTTFQSGFKAIEDFLNLSIYSNGMTWSQIQDYLSNGSRAMNQTMISNSTTNNSSSNNQVKSAETFQKTIE